jgi:hypothetical protein
MSQQIRVTLYHDGSIGTQLSIPPPSLAIVNGITTSKSSITHQLQRKQDIEDFLNEIWSTFGTVLHVVYHKSYTYAIITYRNHTTAVFAFAALNDPIQFAVAMQSAIGANQQRAEDAKRLFQPDPSMRHNNNAGGGGENISSSIGRLPVPVRSCTPTWMD